MNLAELNTKINNLIAQHLGLRDEDVKAESKLVKDLGADSLDEVEIAMIIENECELDIPDDQIEIMKTVGEIQDYVAARLKIES